VLVYRVVEKGELDDIVRRSQFNAPAGKSTPTGAPGKWFYLSSSDALDTAVDWSSKSGRQFFIVEADVPDGSIRYSQPNIDATITMPSGKLGVFLEFGIGLEDAKIRVV